MADEVQQEQQQRRGKRRQNGGLRKVCACGRRKWPKCGHSWHLNYKVRGGASYRFSLDAFLGRHVGSKEEAKGEAENIRVGIRAGTFQLRPEPAQPEPATADANTLKQVTELFLERFMPPKARNRAKWVKDARGRIKNINDFAFESGQILGDKLIGAVTEDDLEVFIGALRVKRAASTKNHHVQTLNQLFRWATKKGYLARNPLSDDSGVKREKPGKRERRLESGVEARLLAVAPLRLQRLIIAGIETCCRAGELLALQMKDVDMERREITIRAENTKDNETRVLPMSSRLYAVLEMARLDPAGHDLKPDGFVFGDGTGRRWKTYKRAWATVKLKAYGHKPEWTKRGGKLSPASRAALKAIDLRFHDLRHEAGSRLHEGGMPLHHVQQFLGHEDLSTTSRYLNVTLAGMKESMRKLDEARNGCKPVANETATGNGLACNDEPTSAPKALVN